MNTSNKGRTPTTSALEMVEEVVTLLRIMRVGHQSQPKIWRTSFRGWSTQERARYLAKALMAECYLLLSYMGMRESALSPEVEKTLSPRSLKSLTDWLDSFPPPVREELLNSFTYDEKD